MKKVKELHARFLEIEGYPITYPKKDIRILYDMKNGKLDDLIVEEFIDPSDKQFLYRSYSRDFGNCLSDWDEWTLSDILIKIFAGIEVPKSLVKKILLELSKVDEWRPELAHWIYRNYSGD